MVSVIDLNTAKMNTPDEKIKVAAIDVHNVNHYSFEPSIL